MQIPGLEEFTRSTCNIAAEDGFADYLPTLVVDGEVRVIEGIPDGVDHRQAIQKMARRLEDKEFLFGVSSGPDEITTGHISSAGAFFMLIHQSDGELLVKEQQRPAWWGLGSDNSLEPEPLRGST